MRPRTLLALFLVVAGLASFIWWVERDLPGTDERTEQAKKLLSFDRQKLTRLTIERGEERVVIEPSGESEWGMVEPVVARVDVSAVEGLLAELEAMEKERTFVDGEAGDLGLAPPRASVVLTGADGEQKVLIGSDVPVSELMIAAFAPTGPFHVVARAAWTQMDRTADEWRDRAVFPGRQGDIERLTLVRGDDRLAMVQRAGDYFLEAPLADWADGGTISRFLDALVALEVTEFVDPGRTPDEDFGFAEAARVLEISTRGRDAAWRLDIGRATASEEAELEEDRSLLFVRADGHVYVVPDTLSDAFERPVEGWRSLEWTGRQVHEIERLELRDTVGTMVLERDAGDWLRDGVKIEFAPVSDLLYAIVGTKAESLDAGEAIAGLPLLSATIKSADAEQIVEIFAPVGDAYPATVSDRESALWLGGDRVRSIVTKVAAVRAATPLGEGQEEADAGEVPPGAPGAAAALD